MAAHKTQFKKKILLALVVTTMCFLVIELGLRIVFAIKVGPSALGYGLHTTRDIVAADRMTDGVAGGYQKYFPNQTRTDSDPETGDRFNATINSRGFRGKDFSVQRTPGVIRVVTLGASSTFGYRSRDNDTYPAYLEQLLNRGCSPTRSHEVINLGIPHLTSGQIYSLFVHEALPLKPDVVTFYEGINDAERGKDVGPRAKTKLRSISVLRHAYRALRDHVMLVRFINDMTHRRVTEMTNAELEGFIGDAANQFVDNLRRIRDECRKRGIVFVAASQQAKSYILSREEISGVTYQRERELVLHKFENGERLTFNELSFIAHNNIMAELEKWTRSDSVPFVDIIDELDQRRDVLVSRVHLTPAGNRMIAEALAESILKVTCAEGTKGS